MIKMKHWTEPSGIFLMHIPLHWKYLNPITSSPEEKAPYSFQAGADSIFYFQISSYPIEDFIHNTTEYEIYKSEKTMWMESRADTTDYCCHLFNGKLSDQVIIGKLIYDIEHKECEHINSQLETFMKVLDSIIIIPAKDRKLASDFDKLERLTHALAASQDLLNTAITSDAHIQTIAVCANQIDAYLRLGIIISKQLAMKTDDLDTKYLFQADNEKGLLEKVIFCHALDNRVISKELYDELVDLYGQRNKVIHRYIISNIKTYDLSKIAFNYINATEKVRKILSELEDKQANCEYGIYGKKFNRASTSDPNAINRLFSNVNEKHMINTFQR